MSVHARRAILAPLVMATLTTVAGGQTITLQESIRRADQAGFAVRAARGTADAAAAATVAALRGILPSMRFEAGYARTDDPIGAFGTRMRQRLLGTNDFNPTLLNRPTPISNYSGALVVEQPIMNADAWIGRDAAEAGREAANAEADWIARTSHGDVVLAYFGAILAAERVQALDDGAEAADAHVRQAESLVSAGMATRSDALLAAVRAGDVRAQLSAARADAQTAIRQLALLMGDVDAEVSVPAALPSSAALRTALAQDTVSVSGTQRSDVTAASQALAAADIDVRRAASLYVPRVNAVARYDWNSASRPYAGAGSWTVGVMASWTPFAGGSELAERQAARARRETARALADAAQQQQTLDLERSRSALRSALERLAIADDAVAQSAEAHRIVARKYAGGLATVVELLDAASAETSAAVGSAAARYAVIAATAQRRKALGGDPASLAELDRLWSVATNQPCPGPPCPSHR